METDRITLRLAIKPPREERKTPLYNDERMLVGEYSLPLWVLAAGPVDHNVPLLNGQGQQVARLRLCIGFEQRATVAVEFGSIECRELVAQKRGYANPMLDISYSKYTFTDAKKTVVATKQKHTLNPAWNHLPPLRFAATYKEMITEWIDVNVQHHSKFDGYASIGRCKLILKAILNDDALVRFDGPITRGNVETGKIKGVATFKFLPIFSQMVGGLQTELGVFGGKQLLPEFLRPKFADPDGLMKRVGEKESESAKLLPATSGGAKQDQHQQNQQQHQQVQQEEEAAPAAAPRQRRGRAATEMPAKPIVTPQQQPASPVAAAVAPKQASEPPVVAAVAKKEKRTRANTEMPAPVLAQPKPKTADDFARDLFSAFGPALVPGAAQIAATVPQQPTASFGSAAFGSTVFGEASSIVVQPSGPSQEFVAFGDNPFASSPFSPSTPPPAGTSSNGLDLASPVVPRAAPQPVGPTPIAENPFLQALATTTNTAPAVSSPLKATFNPFDTAPPANSQLDSLNGKQARRNRSQTDSLLDLNL